MAVVEILDPIHCKIKKGLNELAPFLSYEREYRKKNKSPWGPKYSDPVLYRAKLYTKSSGGEIFLAGLLPGLQKYCTDQNISLEIIDSNPIKKLEVNDPHIPGFNIKEGKYSYQYELIKKALADQRGVIKAATGSGKTAVMLGVLSGLPVCPTLMLSNTYVPLTQFKKSLDKSGLPKDHIEVMTIQSAYRKSEEFLDRFDIILIDECHEGFNSLDCMYGKLLVKTLAPVRLGFTATLPNEEVGRKYLEGFLGPVLGEFTIQEGLEVGVLAKPKIIIREIPETKSFNRMPYRDVYKEAVVNGRALNHQVVLDVKEALDAGETSLVLVQEIQHGYYIVDMAKRLFDLDMIFVRGETDADTREKIRIAMNEKKIKAVVATAVFRKALDIPSLQNVMNACGGMSETVTLQAIGRGLRITDDKKEVRIYDYFNPSNHYLIKHFGKRISMYSREGWL